MQTMTKPKRILYFINALGAGGAERQLLYLLSKLDRTEYEPYVVTIYDERRIPYHYQDELNALAIPIFSLAHGFGVQGRVKAVSRYIRLMWQLRPDIVQGCLHYANLIARAARPFCPPHQLLTAARGVYYPGELRSEARTHWLDDLLIVNGPHLLAQVREGTGRPTDKIRVIANGIPVENFADNPDPSFRREAFGEAGFVIGLVGRITVEKDHVTLLNALHLAQSCFPEGLKVFFVGEVSNVEIQHKIDELVQAYDLGSVICQFPVTDNIIPYYHAADLIVLPSLSEGFPNVILEAFAAGKPVIASTSADAVGIVDEGVNGWHFPTGDAEALAQLLSAAWQMPVSQLAGMGENARPTAVRYSVEAMVSQYTELYQS